MSALTPVAFAKAPGNKLFVPPFARNMKDYEGWNRFQGQALWDDLHVSSSDTRVTSSATHVRGVDLRWPSGTFENLSARLEFLLPLNSQAQTSLAETANASNVFHRLAISIEGDSPKVTLTRALFSPHIVPSPRLLNYRVLNKHSLAAGR